VKPARAVPDALREKTLARVIGFAMMGIIRESPGLHLIGFADD